MPEPAPAAIFTEAGTVATFVLELLRVTVSPPVGARPFRVTLQFTTVVDPPTTGLGVIETEPTEAGLIARSKL